MRLCLILVLIAAGARASSVTNEVIVNSTQTTDSNPRTGSIGDAMAGIIDLNDLFALDLGAMVTSQNNSPPPIPGESGSPVIAFLNAGVAWTPSDNVLVVVGGEWSPTATGFADASIQLATQPATAHIRSVSSELGANLDAAWDSMGESNLEWSFSGGVHFSHWDIDQSIPLVTNKNGVTLTADQVRAGVETVCARPNAAKNCGQRVLHALSAVPFNLNSLEIFGSATAVLFADTDVTLSGDYYGYLQDATQEQYASLIFNGRGGAGVPVAPLQWLVRPEVEHRFGSDVSVKAWVQTGEYVEGTGGSTSGLGVRLQYRFTRRFRMWAKAIGSRDLDEQSRETRQGSFSLGAGYRF